MCTVTFIPDGSGGCYLTSNRDEHTGRARALPPRRFGDITYPKDAAAGGSWVALKQNRDTAILLNGAFKKHQRRSDYRKSRGLVFLDIIHADLPLDHWHNIELQDIEPFTVILFVQQRLFQKRLYECRWDGEHKHVRELDSTRPYIWSSVTLYDEDARTLQVQTMQQWLGQKNISTASILDLHRRMRIEGNIRTVSITTMRIGRSKAKLRYCDMYKNSPRPATEPNTFFIRLKHWEYWPFFIVYAPIFFYWAWLSLKSRSFFFFSTANPTITNSGFLLESKKQIYDLMPEGTYPRTLIVQKGTRIGEISTRLMHHGLTYPLMAKPDIGQRGMGVELLKTECALLLYAMRSKVDFLLQEYVDLPMEIGVFYYRMPGQQKGTITGIVGKEMPAVTGDGRQTVETLLLRNERYVLQLPALRRTAKKLLQTTPAMGEVVELAPYGNHSRGAKFLDHSHRITPQLEAAIDEVCSRIQGFHFGRLDIRFKSWELLEAGQAFSIIELNGAGSEPTHIYDPQHSLFYAWKEITRHWDILYNISRANGVQRKLAPMSFRQGLKMLRDYHRYEKLIAG